MAYDVTEWSDLFVASAGACAALTGLVFVAVSINIERVLAFKGLPERALVTVLLLLAAVIVSILGLAPGQSREALGFEILVVGSVLSVAVVWLEIVGSPPAGEDQHLFGRVFATVPATVPVVIGGLSIVLETGGGLYWVLGGLIGALLGGVVNAWVLLVEILR